MKITMREVPMLQKQNLKSTYSNLSQIVYANFNNQDRIECR